jgi:hypothetical protein
VLLISLAVLGLRFMPKNVFLVIFPLLGGLLWWVSVESCFP